MSLHWTALVAGHAVAAAVWLGGVTTVALAVVPVALAGDVNADPAERIVGRVRTLARLAALVVVATGAAVALDGSTAAALLETTAGRVALGALLAWAVGAVLFDVAAARLVAGFAEKKVRTPASDARWPLRAALLAGVVAVVAGAHLAA